MTTDAYAHSSETDTRFRRLLPAVVFGSLTLFFLVAFGPLAFWVLEAMLGPDGFYMTELKVDEWGYGIGVIANLGCVFAVMLTWFNGSVFFARLAFNVSKLFSPEAERLSNPSSDRSTDD